MKTTDKPERPARALPPRPVTTGIGSLPHHNIDAALAVSFQMDVPFLPQIPIRNPWEFMIPQALEGLPGLEVGDGGAVKLDLDVWSGRAHALDERLAHAFDGKGGADSFESFEPSAAALSSWQPFLWELEEGGHRLAKVQIAGPVTCQWVICPKDDAGLTHFPQLTTQIYRLVLARAVAMCRRLQNARIQPILYLDEPGLYAFSPANPRHVLALQELQILIRALRKEGAIVGLHCCGDTDWDAVLNLDLDILSLDTGLSLRQLLARRDSALRFVEAGGRFSLGVVSTTQAPESLDVRELFGRLLSAFSESWKDRPDLVRKMLSEALYTPACGLALHSTADAEVILHTVVEFERYCSQDFLGLEKRD